jgi:sec-independent protein translocase protein TatA
MHFLFISGAEILFILFMVVIIFGTDRLPEIVRGMAKGMRQLKDAADDVKREIQKSADKSGIDTSIAEDLKESADQVKKSVEEVTGTIKRQ